MKEFDLQKAIDSWKKELISHQGLEPGFIEEIEGNLLDRIDDYLESGLTREEAFTKAREKCMPPAEALANEYYKARTNGLSKPPWQRRPGIVSKLPIHFKIALRNLSRKRVYSILNIAGLAVSICASFLIWHYVNDQSIYDRHYDNADRIYRVIFDVRHDGTHVPQADVGQPVGPTLKTDFPEIVEKTRLRRIGATNTLACEDVSVESADFFVTDPDFFKVFSVELIAGDKSTALVEPNTVVISESLALRLLGRIDVVGEVLTYSGLRPPMDIKITGVMKDLGRHTHLPVEALISYSTYFDQRELINWLRKSYTYVLLNEQNDIASVRAKIPDFCDNYLKEVFQQRVSPNATVNLLLQPLTSIHLADEYLGEPYPHGNRVHLNILSTVLIFLLVMACINYVNLATARAADRAAEVGIRKTLGSSKNALLAYFMTEAVLLSILAGLLAVFIAVPFLPYYSKVTGIALSVQEFLTGRNLVFILSVAVLMGLFAGIYPSFYLTAVQPVNALKGKFSSGRRGVILRKSLIITQYTIASVLIIWILVVSGQIDYMKSRDVGFDKSGLVELIIPDDESVLKKTDIFLQEVATIPQVRATTKTTSDISGFHGPGGQLMEGPDGNRLNTNMSAFSSSYDFIETIGARFVKGRDFDRLNPGEKGVLISESAVIEYGWQGREFEVKYLGRDRQGKVSGQWKVIGVFSDFKPGEAYEPTRPMIIFLNNRTIPEMKVLVGIEGVSPMTVIPDMEQTWLAHFPDHPFDFQLIEDKLNALYWREETFMNLLTALCFITVFITALGIIGLISFTTETRRKEIAIRKVNGAKAEAILRLLSKQFVSLLLVATIVAIPIAYYVSGQWLNDFALNTGLGIWPVLVTFPLCVVFTALSLFYHSLRAARANPIEALRYE